MLAVLLQPGVAAAQCEVAILGGLAVHDKTANTPVVDPTPLTPGDAVDGIANNWAVDSNGLLINATGTSEPVADLLIFDATGTGGCFSTGRQIYVTYSGVMTSPAFGNAIQGSANLDVYDSNGIAGLSIMATASLAFAANTTQTLVTITVMSQGTAGSGPFFPTSASTGGATGAAVRIKNLRFDANSRPSGAQTIWIATAGGVSIVNAGTLAPQNVVATAVAGLVRPTISKSFGTSTMAVDATTSLSFSLNNANAATALNGVAFWDTLPSGLVVATPNGLSGSCGGGAVTAQAGSNVVFLTGATMAPTTSCNISVNVKAINGGVQNNTVQMLSTSTGW